MDCANVTTQEPGELPFVLCGFSVAVAAVTFTFLNHQWTFVGPDVIMASNIARHDVEYCEVNMSVEEDLEDDVALVKLMEVKRCYGLTGEKELSR